MIDFFDYNLYYTETHHCWNPMYIMSNRPYCNNIDDKILTHKINKQKKYQIELYEISNDKNKKIHDEEEDFNKLVNELNLSEYYDVLKPN